MGIVITPESELGKELAKWEQHHTKFCGEAGPGNPYVFRPYPKMLYKAMPRRGGKVMVLEPTPAPWDFDDPMKHQRELERIEVQNKQCYRRAENEEEERRLKNDGWRETQAEAMERYESAQIEVADESARVNYAVQRMSAKAQEEHAAISRAAEDHVVDIVGASAKRRRGKAAKAKAVTGAGVAEGA